MGSGGLQRCFFVIVVHLVGKFYNDISKINVLNVNIIRKKKKQYSLYAKIVWLFLETTMSLKNIFFSQYPSLFAKVIIFDFFHFFFTQMLPHFSLSQFTVPVMV